MNAINVIYPYKYEDMWVFDDKQIGLIQEPFVAGADTIIEQMVIDIPNPEDGFVLMFAGTPFPGYQANLEWRREEYGGNWYHSYQLDMEGWRCSSILRKHLKIYMCSLLLENNLDSL